MGQRTKLIIPEKLKAKYGERFPIWSYSRLSTYHNCTWEYYLGRIKRLEGSDNIYSICGTYSHDILEDLYNDLIKYENMSNKFEENFLEVEISDYKFSSDEIRNENMMKNYKNDLVHFFKTHEIVTSKVLTEKQLWIEVGNNVFIGYVDAIHKEDNNYIITDYKTSSISEFKGAKLKDKQKQLLLYALGLHQVGIPLTNILIRWNFLKYTNILVKHMVNVTYMEKDKLKTSCVKRTEVVNKIKTQLKKDIKDFYEDMTAKELKALVDNCIELNSLSSLPQEIQDKYVLSDVIKIGSRHNWVNTSTLLTQLKKDLKDVGLEAIEVETLIIDCVSDNSLTPLMDYIDIDNYVLKDAYIYGEVNEINVKDLIKGMCNDITDITERGLEDCNWTIDKIEKDSEFYCNVLCGYKKHCKYYTKYLEELKQYTAEGCNKEDFNLIAELENL
jgi:hypothetical protein